MLTRYNVTNTEFLGEDKDDNNWRKLFVVTFESFVADSVVDANTLRLAIDDAFMESGILGHPDAYVEKLMHGIKTNEVYAVTNFDFGD